MPISIHLLLVVAALILTLVSAVNGRVQLWVAVLLLALAMLV